MERGLRNGFQIAGFDTLVDVVSVVRWRRSMMVCMPVAMRVTQMYVIDVDPIRGPMSIGRVMHVRCTNADAERQLRKTTTQCEKEPHGEESTRQRVW